LGGVEEAMFFEIAASVQQLAPRAPLDIFLIEKF
jgi:hypothetical protein